MHNFLFRCPETGAVVQGSTPEPVRPDHYVAEHCPACGGIHLIDPLTGKRPGEAEHDKRED